MRRNWQDPFKKRPNKQKKQKTIPFATPLLYIGGREILLPDRLKKIYVTIVYTSSHSRYRRRVAGWPASAGRLSRKWHRL